MHIHRLNSALNLKRDTTVLAVVLLQLCVPLRSEGAGWGEPRQHDYHTPLDVRAVLVNCDKKPDTSWGRSTLSQFEKEEFYRHNVLKDCHKKIALTLRLEADNDALYQESGDEYIWVESVFDAQSAGTVPLLNPYVVKLRQEPVLQAYNLTFVTTVEDNQNKNIDISSRKDESSDHPQHKKDAKRVKRTIILDGHDPQHSSFSVKIGEVKEEAVVAPPQATECHTTTTENINDCGLEVCTEREHKDKVAEAEAHEKHHKLTHHPHSRPNAPHHHTTSSHPPHPPPQPQVTPQTTTHLTQHTTLDEKRKYARSESTGHTIKALPILSRKLKTIPPHCSDHVRIKRQQFVKSPAIVIGGHHRSNDTLHTEFVAKKDYEEYNESTSNEPKRDAYESKISTEKLERNVKNDLENMYDDSNKRYEEKQRRYSVYSIGRPALWYSAKVQLFEKQSSPDGNTLWSDVTGGSPVSVGSLQPEVQDESDAASMSLRYRAADCLRSEQLLITVPHSLLLLVPRPATMQEKYQSGAGEFLVAPASALTESKRDSLWAKSSALENSQERSDHYEKISHLLSVARPLRSVYPRDVTSANKLSHELVRLHGETFLALRHPRPHHAQLDLEARADDNEIITSETSARVSSIVVDASRRHHTFLKIQVANTGLISGNFRVTITDCPASMNELTSGVRSPKTLIPPHHTRRVKLELEGAIPESASCSVSVLNDKDEVAAIRAFTVKRNDRCFCIWHCKCVCIEQSPHLPCVMLPPEQLAAAGLAADDAPRRTRSVCYSDSRALDALLLLAGLLFILLLLGIVKGILGLVCTRIGVFGLERLVELPRPLVEYYEPWLRCRPVLYDCMGWPIHPDTKRRTVRVMSLTTQLCLNSVFFLTFPCALMWTLVWLVASRLCPCCAARCQSPTAPCYAWTQPVQVSNDRRRDDRGFGFAPAPRWDTTAAANVVCAYNTGLDDTAEESDTNYILSEMQKSKESLARTKKKRGNTSDRKSAH